MSIGLNREAPRKGVARSLLLTWRIVALLIIATVQLWCATNFECSAANSVSLNAGQSNSKNQNSAQASCVTSKLQGQKLFQNGEYLPAYSTRSVPHLDSTGRKFAGYHCWSTNDGIHGLKWYSDAVNAMNDFIIYRYDVGGGAAKQLSLELKGGSISFTNRDGSGKGDALILAVYEGLAPAALFRGKDIDFKKPKPLYGPKPLDKADKINSRKIDPLTIPLKVRAGVKDVSVVLLGVDSWIDTSVTIDLAGIRLLSKALLRGK